MAEILIIQPDRKWFPDFILDERMPHGKEEPSKWLFRLHDGAQAYGDDDRTEHGFGSKSITEGEVVSFSYADDLGTVTLTLDTDGTHTWSAPIPAETTYLWDRSDPETLADTPNDYARFLRDAGETEGDFEVALVHWSDSIPFRFTAEAGEPRFVRVEQKDA